MEPLRSTGAEEAARAFFKLIISRYGPPITVVHDGAGTYKDAFADQLAYWGIKSRRTAPYSPQANGLVERFNSEIMRILRSEMPVDGRQEFNWVQQLPRIAMTARMMVQGSTQCSPYQVLFGKNTPTLDRGILRRNLFGAEFGPIMDDEDTIVVHLKEKLAEAIEVSKNSIEEYAKLHIRNAQAVQKKSFARRHGSEEQKGARFKIGDWVDIRDPNKPKLRPRTIGPYRIVGWKGRPGTMAELRPNMVHRGRNTILRNVKDMMPTTYSVPSEASSDFNIQDRPPELRRGVDIPRVRGLIFKFFSKLKWKPLNPLRD